MCVCFDGVGEVVRQGLVGPEIGAEAGGEEVSVRACALTVLASSVGKGKSARTLE